MIWVFIDASYLAYRAMLTVGHLSHEEIPTGVVFGFLNQLRSICESPRVNSNKVVVFFDSRHSYRKDAYPEYKEKRKSNRSEGDKEKIRLMYKQVTLLRRQILPEIGIQCLIQKGLESDDLIAAACFEIEDNHLIYTQGKRGVIITSDGDLFQCINSHIHWYDPARKRYLTPENFEMEYGINPDRWGEVKSIAGCSSDNVKGIQGVGEKTAVKYLNGKLPATHKTFKAIESEEGFKIQGRNDGLVILPHHSTKRVVLQEPEYDMDAFMFFCEEFHLTTMIKDKKKWKRFFDGKFKLYKKRKAKK